MLRPALVATLFLLAVAPAASAKSPAPCGDADRPEPGLQGQVPKASQSSGDSLKGYWCGLRAVGHNTLGARGGNYQMAWSGDCAYISTFGAGQEEAPAGVAVVDAHDPRAPQLMGYLTSPGAVNAVEALHAVDAEDRHLMVAGNYDASPAVVDVYDTTDCARPKLLTTASVPYTMHNLTLSRDGRTLYLATGIYGQPPQLYALDLTDPSNPQMIASLDLATSAAEGFRTRPGGIHRVDVNADGTRIYAGVATEGLFAPAAKAAFQGGELAIFDTSDIAARKPDAKFRFVSQFQNGWHGPRWFRTGGREYVVGGDEVSPNGATGTYHQSCEGFWPYIGDVTDEAAPKPVGEFRMEIQRTENCPAAIEDGLLYATHYSDIDDPDNAALGLFPMYNSGVRIADLRDPAKPREVGYFNPPPLLNTTFGNTIEAFHEEVDLAGSNMRYHPRTGHIWFASMTSGFWIVEIPGSGRASDLGLPPAAAPAPAQPGSGPPPCLRTLRLKVPSRGVRSARIFVNGRRVRALRSRDLRVPVTLRRLPRKAVRVKIVARRAGARTVTRKRRYPACRNRDAAAGWSR